MKYLTLATIIAGISGFVVIIIAAWALGSSDDDAAQAAAVRRFIARLAADGLWLYEALSTERLDPRLREQVTEEIIALAQGADVMAK